ncbi:uncharacterized protein A4U43_C07F39390 [Asparagus officinalis]|uniref:Berberine/berberine-like domain-containing protein n=1 Tax=Asparagus officinalis TaxID=4686 RepID=A0A5P1EIC7_ASPOF|nr:uncharacterized protein A4U43_C07F39390 [Asparagus officinalis]
MSMLPMGGTMEDVSEGVIPFLHRQGNLYSIQYFTGWFRTDDQSIQKHLDMMNSISVFMCNFITSNPRPAYYGYKDIDLGRNKSYNDSRVWGERNFKGNFERLARIKREVDAGNYFRSEQSIPPYNSWVGVSASLPSPTSNPLSVTLQFSTDACICTNKVFDFASTCTLQVLVI